MKTCIKCKIEKELVEFNKNKKNLDGYVGKCKMCLSEYGKEKYNRNKIEINKKNKEYGQKWREKNKEYGQKWREKNKEYKKEKDKEYRENNILKIKSSRSKYYQDNKEETSLKNKIYREKNKEKINEKGRSYAKANKEKRNKRHLNRMKNDVLYKISFIIRTTIQTSIKRSGFSKKSKTKEILGCSFEEFLTHIESKFEIWMNWGNKGLYNGKLNYGWDLDHIIPTSSAETAEEIYKLNHFSNFQPLDSYINRVVKKDKIDYYK